MAINLNKYVDISTIFPSTDVAGRAFGGLVFTGTKVHYSGTEYSDLAEQYNNYKVTYLSLDAVYALFGKIEVVDGSVVGPAESIFARGYYGYMSPTGRFASKLAFCRMKDDETPSEALFRADGQPDINGFGSVFFLSLAQADGSDSDSDPDTYTPTLAGIEDAASANEGEKLRGKYLIVVGRMRGDDSAETVASDVTGLQDTEGHVIKVGLKNYKGVCYVCGNDSVSAYMPMAILGSTDFENGQVTNYMFKQFAGEIPVVTTDADYETFAKADVNFYGMTQTNGQTLAFYQRGYNTNGIDTSIYCNEMWFKSSCESALINLLLGRERLPANDTGVAFVSNTVTEVCLRAVANGAFMNKTATANDVRTIAELINTVGGNYEDAVRIASDIGVNGYSVFATLKQKENIDTVMGNHSEYVIVYYVFYGTADSIRFIKGNDVLI